MNALLIVFAIYILHILRVCEFVQKEMSVVLGLGLEVDIAVVWWVESC